MVEMRVGVERISAKPGNIFASPIEPDLPATPKDRLQGFKMLPMPRRLGNRDKAKPTVARNGLADVCNVLDLPKLENKAFKIADVFISLSVNVKANQPGMPDKSGLGSMGEQTGRGDGGQFRFERLSFLGGFEPTDCRHLVTVFRRAKPCQQVHRRGVGGCLVVAKAGNFDVEDGHGRGCFRL